jgi:hypothetical protein
MYRQSVKPNQTTINGGDIAALALLSGESEKRLQVFAKVHQNKSFSKQDSSEAFAGIARTKTSSHRRNGCSD